MAITKERQVNESPKAWDIDTPLLRDFGHAINKLIEGWPVVPTASLPPASPLLDGLTVIENAGGATRNLIFYVSGNRYRISGGAAF